MTADARCGPRSARARRRRRGGRPCPRPRRARSPLARPGSSRSSRAASSAWIVGGTATAPRVARRHPVAVRAFEQAVVDQHREHLLDEERVAFGRIGHPAWTSVGQLRPAEEVLDELSGLGLVQRLEQDRGRVELAAAPAGSAVEQLGSREANEQDRRVPSPVGDVLDEIEEGRLRPIAGRRRRRRAAARAPAPRTACARPRRSPRSAPCSRRAPSAARDSLGDQLRVLVHRRGTA